MHNLLKKLSYGAASVIRTRDLTLTKGALYRWSYGSIPADGSLAIGGRHAGLLGCGDLLSVLPQNDKPKTRLKTVARTLPRAASQG